MRKKIRRKQRHRCPLCKRKTIVRFNSKPPTPKWAKCRFCGSRFIAEPIVRE